MNQRKFITINNTKIELRPFKAKDGLEILVELAGIVDKSVSMLSLLNEKSNSLRMAALTKLIVANPNLSEFIFKIVSKATLLPIPILETEATTGELLRALIEIMKLNNWDQFWAAAYSLRLVDQKQLISWNFLKLKR